MDIQHAKTLEHIDTAVNMFDYVEYITFSKINNIRPYPFSIYAIMVEQKDKHGRHAIQTTGTMTNGCSHCGGGKVK